MLYSLIGSAIVALSLLVSAPSSAATGDEQFTPKIGQGGKDVIWVPSPDELVKLMLERAAVTPNDIVYDLGAGDGKIAIAAAKDFGARATGIEYNPDMAGLARRNAQRAGVSDKVTIVQGDIFEHDFSDATVVTLYLLPSLNVKLRPKLLELAPGTRIVSNSFDMGDWEPDDLIGTESSRGYYWVVPAKVQGSWEISGAAELHKARLDLVQHYQNVGGTITIDGKTSPILSPSLSGKDLTIRYTNQFGQLRVAKLHVDKDTMTGELFENTSLGDLKAKRIK